MFLVIVAEFQKISHLDSLVNLETLDLSYNRIGKIEGLGNLRNLQRIYFVHNRISQIEGLGNLLRLEYLELGDNVIKVWFLLVININLYLPVFFIIYYYQTVFTCCF